MLILLDKDTAFNLEAVASVRFSGDSDESLQATVKFLSSEMEEKLSGEAAKKLYEIIERTPEPAPKIPQTDEESGAYFFPQFTRTKSWYYYKPDDPFQTNPKGYILAFVNSKGSCSMRTFDAETGRFLQRKYESGNYEEKFGGILGRAKELTVNSQPNLERDCRERLPEQILAHLKKQIQ